MKTMEDLSGMRFSKLVVLKLAENTKKGDSQWLCKCDCGKEKIIQTRNLKNGNTKSCGCFKVARLNKFNTKHGKTNSRLFRIWCGMKNRCYRTNEINYKNYGAKGIVVCSEWFDFEAFYNWSMKNGYRDDLTIDRIDNDGNYEPSNCRWGDVKTQARNTTRNVNLKIGKETKCLKDWSFIFGVEYRTLWKQYKKHGEEYIINKYSLIVRGEE